ncbi:AaceriAER038Cp [[Ashbya] aceris (nom. inval.)]|nr:AaceriAER038Cp [[Ashbya] aceris (nom. inval.)]
MAIRHFRRQREHVSSGSSSDVETSDGSSPDAGADEQPTDLEAPAESAEQGAGEHAAPLTDSDSAESDDEDSEESSSSSEEFVLHRPVFLKERTSDTGVGAAAERVSASKQGNLEQVQHHNAVQDKERALRQVAASYSTDKELLHRIAQLETDGDTDTDAEKHEHEMWVQRRRRRMSRLREEERRRQSELEENEAARLTNSALPIDDAGGSAPAAAAAGSETAFNAAKKRKATEAKFKPSKVQKPQLKRTASPSRADENEFSIL